MHAIQLSRLIFSTIQGPPYDLPKFIRISIDDSISSSDINRRAESYVARYWRDDLSCVSNSHYLGRTRRDFWSEGGRYSIEGV